MIICCAVNAVVASSNKDLSLDAKTEVDLLPGLEPCVGVKPEDRFYDIKYQDKGTVESLSLKADDTQY